MEWVFKGADLIAWKDFIDYAILGGPFTYYPDQADLTVAATYEMVDTDWSPRFSLRTVSRFTFKMRLLPGPPGSIRQVGKLIWDFGGLQMFGNKVIMPGPTLPGNLLFAFIYFGDLNAAPNPTVSDNAGNTWTRIFYNPQHGGGYSYGFAIFVTAASAVPTTQVTFLTGGNRSNSEMWVVELNIPSTATYGDAGAYGTSNTASVTVDATTLSVPMHFSTTQWAIYLAQFPVPEVLGATFWLAFIAGTIDFPTPPAAVFPPSGWSLVYGAAISRIIAKGQYL
jgi:hypothetical protein